MLRRFIYTGLTYCFLSVWIVGCTASQSVSTPVAVAPSEAPTEIPTEVPTTATPEPTATPLPATPEPTLTLLPATATPLPTPQALVLRPNGDVEIRAAGDDQSMVLATLPVTYSVTLSPDGAFVAFHDGDTLKVRSLFTGKDLELGQFDNEWGSVAWSPISDRLLYSVEQGNGVDEVRPQLWLATLDGQPAKQIAEGFAPAWSPDGQRIAFISAPFESSPPFGGGPGGRVMIADADGKDARQVGSETLYPGWQPLIWSADSARLAAGSEVIDGATGTTVFRADPGDKAYISGIQAISPDGSAVGFWRNLRTYNPDVDSLFEQDELALVKQDGSEQQLAITEPSECPCLPIGGQIIPVWTPAGNRIFLPTFEQGIQIYTSSGEMSGMLPLPDGATVNTDQPLRMDRGAQVVLATLIREQRNEVWLLPLDGSSPQSLGPGSALGWRNS